MAMPDLLSRRPARALLVVTAMVVAVAAPLATSSGGANATTIAGASSLSDKVEVQFAPKTKTSTVHLLAFNDLHGNLEPPGTLYGQYAGGAPYLAKVIKDRQALYGKGQATLFAGDNIGASPLANGLFFEEPITIASNLMNVDFASVGNHEFDKGSAELQRIQNGGCHPVGGCTAAPYQLAGGGSTDVYPGADFQYLSANVIVDATGRPLFPAYGIKKFQSFHDNKDVPVGFIGVVLEATPTIVTPTGVAGLTFIDEADAANAAVKELKKKGVKTFVLVIHQGGFQGAPAALNGCAGNLAGSDILEIAQRLDPEIKVIVSAHTHAEYRCTITTPDGVTRLITSASSFGRIVTDITLNIDKNGKLTSASADNVLVVNSSTVPPAARCRRPDQGRSRGRRGGVAVHHRVGAARQPGHRHHQRRSDPWSERRGPERARGIEPR